eukprot:COSAG01_NODE_17403_length_1154_cov_1.830332_3_plen_77_part_01
MQAARGRRWALDGVSAGTFHFVTACGSLQTHRHVSLEGAGRGGGYCVVTFYRAQAVLHCAQGTLLSFAAALTHAGMP